MIRLHPIPDASFECPGCAAPLVPVGWYMPGMRPLASLVCERCRRGFYGDLPVAQALYTPMLLDQETGEVHDRYDVPWFARWLGESYAQRSSEPPGITFEELRPVQRPLLLNCLDKLYGHGLLKLFNAQHYLDHHPDRDLILLLPRHLRWLVPERTAAVWTVDLPLRRGTEWNDALAAAIAERIAPFDDCMVSVALPHPHPDDVDIERFTGVVPMGDAAWKGSTREPVVTFIWREDRLWSGPESSVGRLARHLMRAPRSSEGQRTMVIVLAENLRRRFPALRFNVVGPGRAGEFPEWMHDHRAERIDDAVERNWCGLYAASHLVIGVHGSNMLLPSAHAGAVLELVPHDRWGNYLQDLHLRFRDSREAMIHTRLVPDMLDAEPVAAIAASILRDRNAMMLNLGRDASLHGRADIATFARRRLDLLSGTGSTEGGEG